MAQSQLTGPRQAATLVAMEPTGRAPARASGAKEPTLHEQIGHARCEVEQLQDRLAELQASRDELRRQCRVVDEEVTDLQNVLEDKLGHWCELDDLSQRHEVMGNFLAKIEAVQQSTTFRITRAALRVVHRGWWLVTLRWLRRGAAS